MPKNKDISIIYGRHPVVDALRSGTPIDKVMLQQGIRGEMEKELRHLCREEGVPMQVVPKERLNKIVRGNHQGVIALQALIRYYRLEDVLPTVYERSEAPLIVLLDGVTDVRNFGAIARTAEAAGAHALVIPQKNSAQINAEAMKTSAGALAVLPVCRESSLIAAIEYLQLSGVKVLASSLEATRPLYELSLREPVAFILGAEGEGISPAVARAADELFIIPQKGTTDSFNVSVAAGMMLYEAMRQRDRGEE
ncbi:MAG: 23S rRNA (guanosine(2251)-2'-O)-methyltransferase RlmB [Lewinellaceae bacterium]|nr:23S rRNA (guanosine(2251)-2'-O)-methyltransferase RlmB [Lewinellaceae bacterium]